MIKFSHAFLDEIRSRISTSEVVRRKVALKSNGRELTGLCPFHKEKSPSFTVSDEKGFYHCFGCGAHGDIIRFAMETEGLSYPEAVRQLADQAGLAMPKITAQEEQRDKQVASFYEIMNLAKNWFTAKLYASEGRLAQEYLNKRQINKSAVEIFGLGFAPENRHGLKDFLKTKGVLEAQMLELGLLVKNERGEIYDKFRSRLMFPIYDARGQVIAFGGRTLNDGQPKYLNSPDTPLFKKGDVLYNEHLARKTSFKTGRLVIAEGYMDVITMYMAGINEVVAPLGTAITQNQLVRMWNLAKEPVMCLDGDAAGKRAMQRAASIAVPLLKSGTTLKFTHLPPGLDPDDVIRNRGEASLVSMIEKSQNLSDFLWENELARTGIKTPEASAMIEKNLNELASSIKDSAVSNHYKKFFSIKLKNHIFLKNKYKKHPKDLPLRQTNIEQMSDINIKAQNGAEKFLIIVMLNNPLLLNSDEIIEELSEIDFSEEKMDAVRNAILEMHARGNPANKENLFLHLEKSDLQPYISYLDGLNLYQGVVGINSSEASLHWRYAISNYNLAVLKKELAKVDRELTEQSWLKASEMRNQIAKLEEYISHMELTFVGS